MNGVKGSRSSSDCPLILDTVGGGVVSVVGLVLRNRNRSSKGALALSPRRERCTGLCWRRDVAVVTEDRWTLLRTR